jgi:hypothetical protein
VSRSITSLLLVCLAAVPAGAADRGKSQIDPLHVEQVEERVSVSFGVTKGLEEETLERIRSGIPVSQQHRVELIDRRGVWWTTKVHARLLIETTAVYDSLSRRYELTRTIWAGPKKKKGEPVEDLRFSTELTDKMREWMTEFDGLPSLEVPDDAVRERLVLRVESTLGRRFVMYMFPAKITASAESRLVP